MRGRTADLYYGAVVFQPTGRHPVSTPLRIAVLNDYEIVVKGLVAMLEPFTERLQVVDAAAGAPLNPEPHAPIDVVLYDPFAARRRHQTWRELTGVDWSPRRVVLYTWEETAEAARRPEQSLEWPDLNPAMVVRVSKRLEGEALVAALEALDRTEHDGDSGPVSPAFIEPVINDDDLPTARQWPGKPEGLTERESEILALITQGFTNQDVADRLYLSINTIKSNIRSAYRKIDVTTRTTAMLWCLDHGFAHHPERLVTVPGRAPLAEATVHPRQYGRRRGSRLVGAARSRSDSRPASRRGP